VADDDRRRGEQRRPCADENSRSLPRVPAAGKHHREHPGEERCRGRRDKRAPVPREREVGDPGGVVDAGKRRPRPGDAGGIAGGAELSDLGQELRDRENGRRYGGVVEHIDHGLWRPPAQTPSLTANYAELTHYFFQIYSPIADIAQ
jgi:hypothetical protein